MAKVALCWELGAGNGHLAKLAQCTEYLIEQGHDVSLISRNLATVKNFSVFQNINLYQSPVLVNSLKKHEAVNYSSVLLMSGYDDSANLYLVLKAWQGLFKAIDADFIIAEHSPAAILAAQTLDISHAMIGSSFVVPYFDQPMPSITPWLQQSESKRVIADEQLLLNINQALDKISSGSLSYDSLLSVFESANKWLIGLPELDHYASREEQYFKCENRPFSANEPVWQAAEGEKVFIYLNAGSPHLMVVLKQLSALNVSVLAVVPDIQDNLKKELQSKNIHIQKELVDIELVAKQCRIIMTHGAFSTVTSFLLNGIPCLLLPSTIEQTMLAYRLASSQLAFSATPDANKIDIDKMLKAVKTVDKVWENARIFAERYKNDNQTKNLADALKQALG